MRMALWLRMRVRMRGFGMRPGLRGEGGPRWSLSNVMLDRACDSWCHAGWERRYGRGRRGLLLSRRGWSTLSARDDGRFLGKHIAQDGEEVEDGRLLLPVSSVQFEYPNVNVHPKIQPIQAGMDGRLGPGHQRAALAAPPCSRSGSRRPGALRGGRRRVPIVISGIGMSCRGRRRGWCPSDGGGGRMCRWGMLRPVCQRRVTELSLGLGTAYCGHRFAGRARDTETAPGPRRCRSG